MPRFKDHPKLAIASFLTLCAVGIWSMSGFFGNRFSPYTYVYGAMFAAAIILLSMLMRWVERDIREERERRKLT